MMFMIVLVLMLVRCSTPNFNDSEYFIVPFCMARTASNVDFSIKYVLLYMKLFTKECSFNYELRIFFIESKETIVSNK